MTPQQIDMLTAAVSDLTKQLAALQARVSKIEVWLSTASNTGTKGGFVP